jgi:hypothetical protein
LRTHVEAHPSNFSHGRNQRKTLQIARMKIGSKIPPKIKKLKKHISTWREVIQSIPTDVFMQIKSLQGVKITQTSFHTLEDWGDLSFLSSLL